MIRLQPPEYDPRGPDGKGRNRLRIEYRDLSPQCALRPTSYATLVESQDTRRARWGSFRECAGAGPCTSCPTPRAEQQLPAFGDRVCVRIEETPTGEQPWVMNRPDRGWGERGMPVSWDVLAQLTNFQPAGQFTDKYGAGFWLERVPVRQEAA